jgi:hypothetical protein
MVQLTKKELIVIGCVTLFAVIWTILIIPFLSNYTWFQNQIPPVQFLLFESGLIIAFIAALGLPITYLTSNKRISTKNLTLKAVKYGISAWIGASVIFDLWEPPYYISSTGVTLLNNPGAMTGSAVDAALAWVWQSIGVHGVLLYYAVYIFTPIMLVVLIALLFTWKRFIKVLAGGI